LFKEGSAEPAANRTVIIEFMVADVDAELPRLGDRVERMHGPKMIRWGNKSARLLDPEGTIVALFAPVTAAALARVGSR